MSRRGQSGYSLLELAVALAILGALGTGMHSAFEAMQQARLHNAGQADAEAGRQALRAYVLRNKRLPCPDTSAYGDRGRSDGSCAQSIGWLPYETLGLDIPVRERRMRYGVYRSGTIDLAAPTLASVDEPDLEGRSGYADLLERLATQPPSTAVPWYSPDAIAAGAACTGVRRANPAFVLVAPGAALDDPGAGAPFDGPNRGFATGTSLCVAPPSRGADSRYDDVVVAESASALLGWLATTTR